MDKCSVCGKEFTRFKKSIRGKGKIFRYCDDCYGSWFTKTQAKAMELVMKKVKDGKKIDLKDTLSLVKELVSNDTPIENKK